MPKKYYIYTYQAADFLAAGIAWLVFFYLRKKVLNEGGINDDETYKLIYSTISISFFWVFLYYFFGSYHKIYTKSRIKEIFNLVLVSSLGTIVVFLFVLLDDKGVTAPYLYYETLSLYFVIHLFISCFIKVVSLSFLKKRIKSGEISFNTLLIGEEKKAISTIEELTPANHILGLNYIGYITIGSKTDSTNVIRNWGGIENVFKVIRRCNVERIIVTIDPAQHNDIKKLINLLAGMDLKISVVPDLYQILIGSVKVDHVLGVPLIDITHDLMPHWQVVCKRLIDVVFSGLCLFFGLPIFCLFAFITKTTSKGPVFYFQNRIGKNGIQFKIIKFRSMYMNAELQGPALSSDNDPRITTWGKFMRKTRIDELPQFFNVFKGDMSLVGPRPERQFFIDQITQYAPEYRHLHKIRPGITSLGQVKYGYAENIDQMLERLKYDLLYIENMSIANDFRILYFTILTVLGGKGK